jgi:hypothetical protein
MRKQSIVCSIGTGRPFAVVATGSIAESRRHRCQRRRADVLLEATSTGGYIKSPDIPFHLWLRGLARSD